MIGFWVTVALMLAGALGFVLWPLARRTTGARDDADAMNVALYRGQRAELDADLAAGTVSQAQYDEAQKELARRLLDDVPKPAAKTGLQPVTARGLAFALAVGLPLAAVLLYLKLGNVEGLAVTPADLRAQREQQKASEHMTSEQMTPEQWTAAIGRAERHLKSNPDDAKGWSVLARAYRSLGRAPDAVRAFENAVRLTPNDAQLKTEFAEALAVANDGNLQGRPAQLLDEALKIDANAAAALALAGSAAMQRNDRAAAVGYWQRLLALLPPDAPVRDMVTKSIAQASGGAPPAPAAPAGASIKGKVVLSPALKDKISPGDALFIFARAADKDGPKMPLAVIRAKASELPRDFILDDSMAMAQGLNVSAFPHVIVVARVSKSGAPTSTSGDLEGFSATVRPGATGVEVVIDKITP